MATALDVTIARVLETPIGEPTDIHRAIYCIAKMLECSRQNHFREASEWYARAERFRDDAILSIPVLTEK